MVGWAPWHLSQHHPGIRPPRGQDSADSRSTGHTIRHMDMSKNHNCNQTQQAHTEDALEAPASTVACLACHVDGDGSQDRRDWQRDSVNANDADAVNGGGDHLHMRTADLAMLLVLLLLALFLSVDSQAS